MSREFKDFDKKYKHLAGTALKWIESFGGRIAKEDIEQCDHWPFMAEFTEAYDHHQIRYACYEQPGASLVWQQFRVRLKGLSTKEKLYALGWFKTTNDYFEPNDIIRVNNYLGALKRGGQLDQHLRVVK